MGDGSRMRGMMEAVLALGCGRITRSNRLSRRTTIFFATDIHGSERCFIKFINAAKFYQADVLILGGDITGKAMVPIVRQANGASIRYRATFLGQTPVLESEEAVT